MQALSGSPLRLGGCSETCFVNCDTVLYVGREARMQRTFDASLPSLMECGDID